ncbi:MAG: hypothetical protein ACRDA4_10090 [Filifactoraceae bacterium]
MNELDIITNEELVALENYSDYFFKGGIYEGKLLTSPTKAYIYITKDNQLIVITTKDHRYEITRKVALKDIKRAISGQGTVTMSLGLQKKSLNLLLDSAERGDFIKFFGSIALYLYNLQQIDTNIEKIETQEEIKANLLKNEQTSELYATDIFIEILKSRGVKSASTNAEMLEILMGLIIAGSLVFAPILKLFVPVIIIVCILIIYIRNNYF